MGVEVELKGGITTTDLVIAKLDTARQALAEAKTIQETKKILDVARAAEIYARRQELGEEAIQYATSIKVEALAQLGRMLKETERNPGTRTIGGGIGAGSNVLLPPAIPTLAELGLDKKTSKLAQDIANLPDEEVEKIKAGVITLSNVSKLIRTNKLEAEREAILNAPPTKCKATIYHGDFREVLGGFDDNSIDHIFTDPPYSETYLPLWGELSAIANRILKPGGLCICYSGTYHLPEAMQALGRHLTYCWQLILLHEGTWQRIQSRCIVTGYKPILVYYKPPYRNPLYDVRDIVIGTGREKELHDWAQAVGEAIDILERLTLTGETILDPFMGSGTIPLATLLSSRQSIGIDKDEASCNMSKKRIYEWETTMGQTSTNL